jgi:hypothetical protein
MPMTRQNFAFIRSCHQSVNDTNRYFQSMDITSGYLRWLWIPNRMAALWFERRDRPVPSWLKPQADGAPAAAGPSHAKGVIAPANAADAPQQKAPEKGMVVHPRSRGSKGGLTKAAAQKMVEQVRGGLRTWDELNAEKLTVLAADYGVKSRSTIK